MTATERLRAMLDERGVEWGNIRNDGSESDYLTEWQFEDNQGEAIAIEWSVGSGLSVKTHRYHLTPEQAIAATLGAGTIDKAAERIEVLSGFAREYLHRYGYLMSAAGEDVTDEVWAIEQVINEVCGAKVVDG